MTLLLTVATSAISASICMFRVQSFTDRGARFRSSAGYPYWRIGTFETHTTSRGRDLDTFPHVVVRQSQLVRYPDKRGIEISSDPDFLEISDLFNEPASDHPHGYLIEEYFAGWPIRCMYARQENIGYESKARRRIPGHMTHGFNMHRIAGLGEIVFLPIIPTMPIMKPFLLNTIFWCGPVGALFFARPTVRAVRSARRRSRGLCVSCAYPVPTAADRCPECGTVANPHSGHTGPATPVRS
jgi:hypothetical protein